MRDHDRAKTPSLVWRLVSELVLGRLHRRIGALKAEHQVLAARIAELERIVADQDRRLKTLSDLVPRAMGRPAISADAFRAESSDRPKTLH